MLKFLNFLSEWNMERNFNNLRKNQTLEFQSFHDYLTLLMSTGPKKESEKIMEQNQNLFSYT